MFHPQNKRSLIIAYLLVSVLLSTCVEAKENDAALDRLLSRSDNIRLSVCSANYDPKRDQRYYILNANIAKRGKLLVLRQLFSSVQWQWDESTAVYKRDEMEYSSFEVVIIQCNNGRANLGQIRVSAGRDVWINQDYYGTIKSNIMPEFWRIFRDEPWRIWTQKKPWSDEK